MINEVVYLGSSNSLEFIASNDGVPIDFISIGVTSMELYIGNTTVTSDTDKLNYFDEGRIVLTLGDVDGVDCRKEYAISLKIFTDSDTLGRLIIHPNMKNSSVSLEVVSSKF